MIKKVVTIEFKDDHKEVYDCIDYPRVNGPFYSIFPSKEEEVDIPLELIGRIHIREVWKKHGNEPTIQTPKRFSGFERK